MSSWAIYPALYSFYMQLVDYLIKLLSTLEHHFFKDNIRHIHPFNHIHRYLSSYICIGGNNGYIKTCVIHSSQIIVGDNAVFLVPFYFLEPVNCCFQI